MPPIRTVQIGQEALLLDDGVQGRRVFPWSNLPENPRTVETVETIVTNWLNQSADGHYQVAVHVFDVSPLKLAVLTANMGETIPPNWWGE